ncbi:hypothetical protein ACE193_09610 [Bernardetia sp. OM2101]|uniref:hypothetical protein n=1 Tax=Bernardetia sp. OM2101 TaxID=3344876 RepID=UPI0035D08DC0
MKYLRKLLNPLNPILPAFLLLIAFLWFGYSDFVKEKYTEEEKMIFKEGIKFTDELSEQYHKEFKTTKREFYEGDVLIEFALRKSYLEIYQIDNRLDSLREVIVLNELKKITFSEKKEIPITSIFKMYINEAKKIVPLLEKRYQNFELENGLNNSQLNQLYFSRDSLESKYHLARFETQLMKMYTDDIHFIRQETITHKIEKIVSNYKMTVHVSERIDNNGIPDGKRALYLSLLIPFDTASTRIVAPENVKTCFNEKGFLIIPPSLRNNDKKLTVSVTSEMDTTLYTYKR